MKELDKISNEQDKKFKDTITLSDKYTRSYLFGLMLVDEYGSYGDDWNYALLTALLYKIATRLYLWDYCSPCNCGNGSCLHFDNY